MSPRFRRPVMALALCLAASGGARTGAAPPPAPADSLRLVLAVAAPGAEPWPPAPAPPAGADPLAWRRGWRAARVAELTRAGEARLAPLEAALEPLVRQGELRVLARYPAFGQLVLSAPPRLLPRLRAARGLVDLWRVEERRLAAIGLDRDRPGAGAAGAIDGGMGPAEAGAGASGPAAPTGLPAAASQADHLNRIRAPEAWRRLGGLGEGLVIGFVDSGVDGQHPLLSGAFRGRRERRLDRDWLDLTPERSRVPVDGHGHGSHVAGLALGRDGALAWGAAPGARWMAARAFDAEGKSDDLGLLAALDWMLRPGLADGLPPDAAAAPDLLNLSWTLDNGADDRFRPALQALRQAEILVLCAAGNLEDARDPWPRVLAPASYPEAFAVGALGRADRPWAYSRPGPGAYGGVKPALLAPGEAVWSSLPGGETGPMSGSSMATPLASGAAAVLWGQAPWLSAEELAALLMAGAADLGSEGIDPASGYGRLDLSAGLDLARRVGRLEGRLGLGDSAAPGDPAAPGAPLAGARLALAGAGWPTAWAAALGQGLSDAEGRFRLLAPAGPLRFTASHPLARPLTRDLDLPAGPPAPDSPATSDLRLEPADHRPFAGRLAGSLEAPLSDARLSLAPVDAPARPFLRATPAADGSFTVEAPAGRWLLRAEAAGHRALTRTLELPLAPAAPALELRLAPAPRVLLVGADAWDGEAIGPYLERPLQDLGLPYARVDLLAAQELPPSAAVDGADLLWWAHAYQSPGRLDQLRGDGGATGLLRRYLAGGGDLLLSGQDIALWDQKRGLARDFQAAAVGLGGSRDRGIQEATQLSGEGPLAGLSLDAAWAGGAAKVRYAQPDSLEAAGEGAETLLRWSDGSPAALGRIGGAFPGGRTLLGFGPESSGGRLALARLLEALAGLALPADLALVPAAAEIAPAQALGLELRLSGGGRVQEAELTLGLPPGLDLLEAGGLTPGARPGEAVWQGLLEAAETRAFPLRLALGSQLAAGRPLTVTATLDSGGRRRQRRAVLLPRLPDLVLESFAARPGRLPSAGGRATLGLALRNVGPVAADGAEITVTIPPGLTVPPASLWASGGRLSLEASGEGPRLSWRGPLAPGEDLRLAWSAEAPPGRLEASWAATLTLPGLVDRVWRTDLQVGGPDLAMALLDPPPAGLAAGERLDLRLRLSNRGDAAARARLQVAAEGADAAAWALEEPPGGLWLGELAAGAEETLSLRLQAPSIPTAAGAGLLLRLEDDLQPRQVLSQSLPIALRWAELGGSTAAFTPAEARSGDLVWAQVTLENSGQEAAEALVTESLPPNLVPQAETIVVSAGTVERQPGQLRWRCPLPAGGRETLRYQLRAGGGTETNRRLSRSVRIEGGSRPLVLGPTLDLNPWRWWGELDSRPEAAPAGAWVYQRLRLHGAGLGPPRSVALQIDLPAAVDLDPATLAPGLRPEPDGRGLRYDGPLDSAGALDLAWRVRVAAGLEPGGRLRSQARAQAAGLPPLLLDHLLPVASGDWSATALTAGRLLLRPGEETGLRALARFDGPALQAVSLRLDLPAGLLVSPASIVTSGGPPARWDAAAGRLDWAGDLAPGQALAIDLRVRRDPALPGVEQRWPLRLAVRDAEGLIHERGLLLAAPRRAVFLPWLQAP